MRFACWITKATDRQYEHEIRLAFARQQLLCERASTLRDTYIASTVRQYLLIVLLPTDAQENCFKKEY